MSINLQQMLDNVKLNDTIQLPVGEFEGPFFIRKPCTVIGTSTTLWAKKGSVLVIDASNVKLENIRVEVTESSASDFTCLTSKFNDTKYKGIEVVGDIIGVPNEDRQWGLPKVLSLGEIPSQKVSHFIVEIFVPTQVNIKSDISGVTISPTKLSCGNNKVTINVEAMKENTYIYGEIIFESVFLRKIYLDASIKSNINNFVDNKIIYKHSLNLNNFKPGSNNISNSNFNLNIINLKKGQRLTIKEILKGKIKIFMNYSKLMRPMDIDPYVFLLDKKGKAINDENLIFFGNSVSKCSSVKYIEANNNKTIEIELEKVANYIHSISVAYSIYGDNPSNNFSKVINPIVRISADDEEKMIFSPTDLLIETTIVAIEFYRYKNEWKVNTVGSGYRDGIKRLCESYGLTVL